MHEPQALPSTRVILYTDALTEWDKNIHILMYNLVKEKFPNSCGVLQSEPDMAEQTLK